MIEKMNGKVSPEVRNIIKIAGDEAKRFNDIKIKPEHILLAIVDSGENSVSNLLIRYDDFQVSIIDELNVILTNNIIIPMIVTSDNIKLPASEETKELLNNANKECIKLNEGVITLKHIILSMLSSNLNVKETLTSRNMTYDNFNGIINSNSEYTYSDGSDGIIKPKIENITTKDTPALDNFCLNITNLAKSGKIEPVIGRKVEIKRMLQILARKKKSNPILIGEPGVGKSCLIEGLALQIISGEVPKILMDKQIYSLDLTSLVSGTKYRGQFEERMKAIVDELVGSDNIILFIDEFHTIVGTGNSSGSLDVANILKPALARGEIQCIGATTLNEYRENIEKDGALKRRFQEVILEEPTVLETIEVLHNIKSYYEKFHNVKYSDEVIEQCAKLADRYISDRAMPDKAIDIMDEAGAFSNINEIINIPDNIVELESQSLKIQNDKLEAVKMQNYEEASRIKKIQEVLINDLLLAKESWFNSLNKEEVKIDVDIITNVISTMTGIPINKIKDNDIKNLNLLDIEIGKLVIGQEEAIKKVTKAIKRNRLGIKDKNKPQGVFLFQGISGVGKTLLAKALSEVVFGDKKSLIRVDMSEYMDKFSSTRLIGPPPGYVGYEQGGQLTEKIRRKPYSLILFDEIEKAHPDVLNLLLQVLDEGHITDTLGRKINFKNTLIVMTSNIGMKDVSNLGKQVGFNNGNFESDETRSKIIIQKSLKQHFKPEFLNRIDDIITFKNLTKENLEEIIDIEIGKLNDRLLENGYKVKLQKSMIEYLCDIGYNQEYGARPLNRAIQTHIEDTICEEIINGNLIEGQTIKISYNKTKDKVITTTK